MNPTDPNQPVNPMATPVDPMAPVADPTTGMPQAPVADPTVTPAPAEPVAPVEQPVSTPEPVETPMGEQPAGGMPSGDQGGQMPPTVPPVV
jgi:hypothetical protein